MRGFGRRRTDSQCAPLATRPLRGRAALWRATARAASVRRSVVELEGVLNMQAKQTVLRKTMDSRCARRATRRSPRTSSRSCTCTDARKVGSVRTSHPLGQPPQSSVCANGGRCAQPQNRNTSRSLDAGVFYRKMARRAHQVPHANKPTRIYATYGAPRLKYASRAMRSHPHRAARASATRDTARTHMASDMAPVPPKASRHGRSPAPLNLVI